MRGGIVIYNYVYKNKVRLFGSLHNYVPSYKVISLFFFQLKSKPFRKSTFL